MQDFRLGKWQLCINVAISKKMWGVMKGTAFFLLLGCLQVAARGYTQRQVSLDFENASLLEVFKSIRQQTGYNFFYQSDWLSKAKPVSIKIKDASLPEALELCFRNQPVTYKIIGTSIVLQLRPVTTGGSSPTIDIQGRVINADAEPLAGASITVQSSGKGTTTDADGYFTLKKLSASDVIIVTYAGYVRQTMQVGERTNFLFRLELATNELDQLVVQAYGHTTQRLSTGNITKITADEISRQPVFNPLQALQGRVAGLQVTQTNGYASAPFKVEIRGRNAIGPDQLGIPSDPLYVIDGVPLTILDISSSSSYAGGSTGLIQNNLIGPALGQSPLFSINPQDIESIEVLKDADATAIYGSRGANGVILITTKKGKVGKSKLDVSINQGISTVTRKYQMLNTSQYLQMRREAFVNNNRTMTTGNAPDVLVWDTTRFTDWQEEVWGGTGKNTNVQLTFSGGDSRTSFRLAAGYNRLTDILTVSGAHERVNFSSNLNYASANRRFTLSLVSSFSFADVDMVSFPSNTAVLPPNAPPVYDSTGKLNYAGWTPLRSSYPFARLLQPYGSKTSFLNGNLAINYQLLKGLTLRSSFGYNTSVVNQESFTPIASLDPLDASTGMASFGNNSNRNWIIEPQAEYSRRISKGNFNLLFGTSFQQVVTEGRYVVGEGFTSDALLHTISNAPIQTNRDNYGDYRYSAVFGRLNYNWKNKYVITLSARRDGSSYFGPDNRFGNFGSVGIAWIFTEENWFKKHLPVLSFGKLRASYGTTGGDGQPYKYLTRWFPANNPPYPYNGIMPLIPTQHANPDYHWQVNKKLEAALNIGLFKNRFNLLVAYYRNRAGNQLTTYPIPDFTGFSSVYANSPALVQNAGWEFSFISQIVDATKFKWSLNGNISVNRNKLIDFPNIEFSPYGNTLVIGESLNIRKLLRYTGVDPQTGLYTYEDKNKDGVINTNTLITDTTSDLSYFDRNPKFAGGLGSNLTMGNFTVSLFFTFIKQTGRNALASIIPGTLQNAPVAVLRRWQKPGDVTDVARYTTIQDVTDSYFSMSTGAYTDASYIRLQNLALAYSVPKRLYQKIPLSGISIYLQAQNLFVITNYEGVDPETQNVATMPPSRIITGGINMSF